MFIVWPRARLAFRVEGDMERIATLVGEDSTFYPDAYPCPVHGHEERGSVVEAVDAAALGEVELRTLTPEEAFVALLNHGMPQERDCRPSEVQALFEGRVVRLDTEPVPGANRTLIRSLVFENGARLFLGASPDGAVAYRITSARGRGQANAVAAEPHVGEQRGAPHV